ncbi:MAG: hypothetical protein AAFO94_02275 [Bacteroidota bacterium]
MSITQKIILTTCFVSILLYSSCEQVSTDPVLPLTPAIKLLEVSHEELKAFDDLLSIRIEYEDGDGDLGNSDNDINSLFIRDSRLNETDGYFVGPLAPEDATISIRGTLNIEVGSFFLLGNGSQEKTTLTIYMVDRAGNRSNELETEPITIYR